MTELSQRPRSCCGSAVMTSSAPCPTDRDIAPFFQALDGSRIRRGPEWWALVVVGAHRVGNDVYLQIEYEGDGPSGSLLLRLMKDATVDRALTVLQQWHPSQRFPTASLVVTPPLEQVGPRRGTSPTTNGAGGVEHVAAPRPS
jgi:hypothetical protein